MLAAGTLGEVAAIPADPVPATVRVRQGSAGGGRATRRVDPCLREQHHDPVGVGPARVARVPDELVADGREVLLAAVQRDVYPADGSARAGRRHIDPAGRCHPGVACEGGLIELDVVGSARRVVAGSQRSVEGGQCGLRTVVAAVADVRRSAGVAGIVPGAVDVGRKGVRRAGPLHVFEIRRRDAIRAVLRLDGIHRIRPDGRVAVADEHVDLLRCDVRLVVDRSATPVVDVGLHRIEHRGADRRVVHARRVVAVSGAHVGAGGEDGDSAKGR